MFFNSKKKKEEAKRKSVDDVLIVIEKYFSDAGCNSHSLDVLKYDPKVLGSIYALSDIAANTDDIEDAVEVFVTCFVSIFDEKDHQNIAKAGLIIMENEDAISEKDRVIREFISISEEGNDPTETRIITDTIKKALAIDAVRKF